LGQISLAEGNWPAARRFFERSAYHFERAGCQGQAQQARRNVREIASRQRVANFSPARN
jgi:hypothetical protein